MIARYHFVHLVGKAICEQCEVAVYIFHLEAPRKNPPKTHWCVSIGGYF